MQLPERAVAIVNPRAGQGRVARVWAERAARLQAVVPGLETVFTQGRGHATELARAALSKGTQLILAVGGDGTNNEVLSGFVDESGANAFPEAQLALVPGGRGSDFVRAFGHSSFDAWLAALSLPPQRLDYGVVDFLAGPGGVRVFLNEASIGASTRVLEYTDAASGRLGAGMTYLLSSLRGIASLKNRPVSVRYDGGPPEMLELTLLCIANGRYFGAGMHINPHGVPDDGLFDAIQVTGMSRGALLRALAYSYRGRHLALPGIHVRQCRSLRVESSTGERLRVETDGELSGHLPARFALVPAGVRVRGLAPRPIRAELPVAV